MRNKFLRSSLVFAKNIYFLPADQFAYRKGLGCTDALLTMSHDLQKSSDTGMESYIVQLDLVLPSKERVKVVSYSN